MYNTNGQLSTILLFSSVCFKWLGLSLTYHNLSSKYKVVYLSYILPSNNQTFFFLSNYHFSAEKCHRTIWQKVTLLKMVERMTNWKIMRSRHAGVSNRSLRSLRWVRVQSFFIPRTITAACGEWIWIIGYHIFPNLLTTIWNEDLKKHITFGNYEISWDMSSSISSCKIYVLFKQISLKILHIYILERFSRCVQTNIFQHLT